MSIPGISRTIRIARRDNTATIGFNTTKPFVSIKMEDDGLLLNGVHTPVEGELCLPMQQKRFFAPAGVIEMYGGENFFRPKEIEYGSEKDIKLFAKKTSSECFRLPYGSSYTDEGPVTSEEYTLSKKLGTNMLASLRAFLNKNSEPYEVTVTTVMTEDRTFVLIQKATEKYPCISELRKWFGDYLTYFVSGTMRYNCLSNEVILPACFIKAIGGRKVPLIVKKNEFDNSYIIVADKNCFIDDKKIDGSVFKGEELRLCAECADNIADTVTEAQKIVFEFLEKFNEVVRERDRLKEMVARLEAEKDGIDYDTIEEM